MIQTILQILMVAANIVSFVVFGVDKFNSKRGRNRMPEARLLVVAFFAPFGALVGMFLFRHKTRKIKFLLVPIFALTQTILLVYYLAPLLGLGLFF